MENRALYDKAGKAKLASPALVFCSNVRSPKRNDKEYL
jgi:hypothetical protein